MSRKRSDTLIFQSKKIGKVTRIPDCILQLKGKLNSHQGEGTCDEYILKLTNNLAAIESKEVMKVERVLFTVRKKAAVILTSFSEEYRGNGSLIQIVRENRKKEADKRVAIEFLAAANETIVNVDTILEERINKTRNKALVKIHAYTAGIRAGKLKSYNISDENFDNNAREIYCKKHQMLDQQIDKSVRFYMGKGKVE